MSRALARPVVTAVLTAALAAAAPAPAYAAARATKPAKAAKPAPKPKPKPVPVRYVVVGTFAATDGTTITLSPTSGGNAKVAPGSVTVSVAPSAVVRRDDAPATLADLVAGDHVAASGTRSGTTVTITKVIATSPEPAPVEPDAEPEPVDPAV